MDWLQSDLEGPCVLCSTEVLSGGQVVHAPIPQVYCVFVWGNRLVKMFQEGCSFLGRRASCAHGSVQTLDVVQPLPLVK